jgi:choline dehydrogenase
VAETEDVDIYYFGTPSQEFIGFYPGFAEAVQPPNSIGWSVVKAYGRSAVGTVKLQSDNTRDTPVINFNFFEEDGDLDLMAMTEGVEKLLEVMNSIGEPYAPYEIVQPIPGLSVTQSIADTVFSHHATSSCRMGVKYDMDYCVDSKFRVNGVDGLRVVDGSIFPHTPGAYPVPATFMVSQKAFREIPGGSEQ